MVCTQDYINDNSPTIQAERCRLVRCMANLTREELCNLCNINIHTYKGWENGRFNGVSEKGAKKIVAGLSVSGVICTKEWILSGKGVIPYLVNVNCHHNFQSRQYELILQEIMQFKENYGFVLYCQIRDMPVTSFYREGDFVSGQIVNMKYIDQFENKNMIIQSLQDDIAVSELVRFDSISRKLSLNKYLNGRIEETYTRDIDEIVNIAPIMRYYSIEDMWQYV